MFDNYEQKKDRKLFRQVSWKQVAEVLGLELSVDKAHNDFDSRLIVTFVHYLKVKWSISSF